MNITQTALIKLILSCVLLGSGTIIVKVIDSNALATAFWRLLLAALLVLAGLAYLRISPKISKQNFYFAGLSGFFLAVDLLLWHESILIVGPGIATILNGTQIFVMVLFSTLLYKEKVKLFFLVQMLIAFVGIVLLTGHEVENNERAVYGIVTGLLSGAAWATSVLFMKKMDGENGKSGLFINLFYLSLIGAIGLLPFAVLFDYSLAIVNMKSLLGLLIYAGFIHLLGWVLLADSVRLLPLSITGLLLLLEPLVALLLDIGILDKAITTTQYLGAAITIFAIYLGTMSSSKQKNSSKN